jgi:ribonuclease-3
VITDELYRKNPDAQEGQLAKLRAAVVNAKALADVARTLGLGEFLLLGKGEEATGGRDKSSILADAVEAILGAIYVEHGLAKSGEVILQLFAPILADAVEAILGAIYVEHGLAKSGEVILQLFAPILAASAELGAGLDWKTSLAELVNSKSLGVIEYVIEQSGPDHDKRFSAQVKVGQDLYGNGEGKSKKEAEQHAAASAYTEINNLRP